MCVCVYITFWLCVSFVFFQILYCMSAGRDAAQQRPAYIAYSSLKLRFISCLPFYKRSWPVIAYTAKYRHKHGSPPTVPIATTTTTTAFVFWLFQKVLSLCFASCFHKISITYMREWLTRPRILHFIHINVFVILFYFILGLVCIDTNLKGTRLCWI